MRSRGSQAGVDARHGRSVRVRQVGGLRLGGWATTGATAAGTSAFAEQAHGGGDEQQTHERGVERERDGDAEAHLLERDELAGGEAAEDDDDDRGRAGDQARRGGPPWTIAPAVSPVALQRSWIRLSRNTW